ncbi:hypothetical protein Pla163_23490 [Planctomycetes bacterium Pla163]|uniref:Transporter n=2 Tax=Rohdeia mirabilis TaxID=2528008 RepID=A0A518D163_9BACT|nr:hypothetical protein Pla163_23490 [Planctomycetes bacterium Pla163]
MLTRMSDARQLSFGARALRDGTPLVRLASAALAVALLLAPTAAAQIRVANAGITSRETPQVTETVEVRSFENLQQVRFETRLAIALSGATSLDVTVPVVRNDAEFGALADVDTGLGDVGLRVQHSLHQSDAVMRSTRYAVYATARLPTGDDEALVSGGVLLPRKLQLGLGSVGLGAGAVASFIRDRHRLSFSAGFRWSDEAGGFQLGGEVEVAAAWWYRLRPAVFEDLDVIEVRGVLELIGTWRGNSELQGVALSDAGFEAWLAPGVQVFARDDLLVQASLALPIADGIDDALGEREWAWLLALRWYL